MSMNNLGDSIMFLMAEADAVFGNIDEPQDPVERSEEHIIATPTSSSDVAHDGLSGSDFSEPKLENSRVSDGKGSVEAKLSTWLRNSLESSPTLFLDNVACGCSVGHFLTDNSVPLEHQENASTQELALDENGFLQCESIMFEFENGEVQRCFCEEETQKVEAKLSTWLQSSPPSLLNKVSSSCSVGYVFTDTSLSLEEQKKRFHRGFVNHQENVISDSKSWLSTQELPLDENGFLHCESITFEFENGGVERCFCDEVDSNTSESDESDSHTSRSDESDESEFDTSESDESDSSTNNSSRGMYTSESDTSESDESDSSTSKSSKGMYTSESETSDSDETESNMSDSDVSRSDTSESDESDSSTSESSGVTDTDTSESDESESDSGEPDWGIPWNKENFYGNPTPNPWLQNMEVIKMEEYEYETWEMVWEEFSDDHWEII